jgi:uncharacterized protein (TIGR03067 family)
MFTIICRSLSIRVVVIVLGMLPAAMVEADDAAHELAKLQGTWKALALQASERDKMEAVPVPPDAKIVIQGGKLIFLIQPRAEFGPPDANVCSFTLDMTTSPKRMFFTEKQVSSSSASGQKPTIDVKEIRRTAIYALDGNRLRICMRQGSKDQTIPKDFPAAGTAVDEPTVVIVLERESPGAK